MNDPTDHPIDIADQKTWLREFKANTGHSWSEIGKRVGVATGTISQFGSERGYAGDEQKVAEAVFRYRQLLATQAQLDTEAPPLPGYFQTETSLYLEHMLAWAQRGRVVCAAMGAGTSKTSTAQQFTACYPNVFHVTMAPSTAGVNTMQVEVLAALGEKHASGTPQKLSTRIKDRVKALANGLIIIDEAQHLSEKALEEIRSWNDAVHVGIALFGNIGVMQRLEGGTRGSAYAQLYSRLSLRLVRAVPTSRDAEALADAWRVHDERTAAFLIKIARVPGGLRGASTALELATMIARADEVELRLDHLQDAWAQLSSRAVAE